MKCTRGIVNEKSKIKLNAIGNLKAYVVRVSWVFGINRNNFIKTLAEYVFGPNRIDMVGEGITTSECKTNATRLMNSGMSKDKLEGSELKRLPD